MTAGIGIFRKNPAVAHAVFSALGYQMSGVASAAPGCERTAPVAQFFWRLNNFYSKTIFLRQFSKPIRRCLRHECYQNISHKFHRRFFIVL